MNLMNLNYINNQINDIPLNVERMYHQSERWIVEWDSSGVSRSTERALGLQYHSSW